MCRYLSGRSALLNCKMQWTVFWVLGLKKGLCQARFENGEDIGLENFVKLLNALELSSNLDMLIPDQSHRPSSYIQSSVRKIATAKSIHTV